MNVHVSNRRLPVWNLMVSLVAGVVGWFLGSVVSFWITPALQYDIGMFYRDLFSLGGLFSSLFAWTVFMPSILLLYFLATRVFKKQVSRAVMFVYVFFLSFLLLFGNQAKLVKIIFGPLIPEEAGFLRYLLLVVTIGTLGLLFLVTQKKRRSN